MEAANILEIKELLDRRPKALSGGQRQRVAVGRAIVRHPKVFLFDEPLSNLDAKLRVQMRAEISALHNRLQSTMIYVTHDQVEAMTMGDKIVVMKGGLVQQIGDPLTLYNKPCNKFVAGFIGSPPMNFLSVKIEEQAGAIFAVEESFKLRLGAAQSTYLKPYVGKAVTMGVRAEDLNYEPKAADDTSINTKVEVIETLGSHTEVYVRTKKHQMVARVGAQVDFSVNDDCRLVPNLDKLIFFDTETEETIIK
jgi:multiple sugar transport system ATP-binding protein